MKIRDMNISARAKSCLISAGYTELNDLLGITDNELSEIRNLNAYNVDEIRNAMNEFAPDKRCNDEYTDEDVEHKDEIDENDNNDVYRYTDLDELLLSVRVYNCLRKAGINTVAELCNKRSEELMQISNFGQKSVQEVIEKLKEIGMTLKEQQVECDKKETICGRSHNDGMQEKKSNNITIYQDASSSLSIEFVGLSFLAYLEKIKIQIRVNYFDWHDYDIIIRDLTVNGEVVKIFDWIGRVKQYEGGGFFECEIPNIEHIDYDDIAIVMFRIEVDDAKRNVFANSKTVALECNTTTETFRVVRTFCYNQLNDNSKGGLSFGDNESARVGRLYSLLDQSYVCEDLIYEDEIKVFFRGIDLNDEDSLYENNITIKISAENDTLDPIHFTTEVRINGGEYNYVEFCESDTVRYDNDVDFCIKDIEDDLYSEIEAIDVILYLDDGFETLCSLEFQIMCNFGENTYSFVNISNGEVPKKNKYEKNMILDERYAKVILRKMNYDYLNRELKVRFWGYKYLLINDIEIMFNAKINGIDYSENLDCGYSYLEQSGVCEPFYFTIPDVDSNILYPSYNMEILFWCWEIEGDLLCEGVIDVVCDLRSEKFEIKRIECKEC